MLALLAFLALKVIKDTKVRQEQRATKERQETRVILD
jgi:hypothetical protein